MMSPVDCSGCGNPKVSAIQSRYRRVRGRTLDAASAIRRSLAAWRGEFASAQAAAAQVLIDAY